MEYDNQDFNTFLEAATPRQSAGVQSAQLAAIIARTTAAPVASPYVHYLTAHKLAFSYVAMVLIVVLGTGGTVAAAEAARPGDLLFPVDRASEELRLLLASPEKQQSLNSRFLDERWSELLSILDESTIGENTQLTADDTIRMAAADWDETTSVRFDADVFTDVTVVKITALEQKAYLTTPATTREAVINDMAQRLGLTPDYIAKRLSFTREDRVSTARDYGRVVTAESEDTIVAALGLITATAAGLNTTDANERLREVFREVSDLQIAGRGLNTSDNRIRIEGDRIEIKTEDGRIRIEQKRDGEVRIRVWDADDDDDDDDDNDDDAADDRRDDDRGDNDRDDDDREDRDDDNDDRDDNDRRDDDRDDNDDRDNDDRENGGDNDDRDDENDDGDRIETDMNDDSSDRDDENDENDDNDDRDDNDRRDDDRDDNDDDDNDDDNDDRRSRE